MVPQIYAEIFGLLRIEMSVIDVFGRDGEEILKVEVRTSTKQTNSKFSVLTPAIAPETINMILRELLKNLKESNPNETDRCPGVELAIKSVIPAIIKDGEQFIKNREENRRC